MRCNYRPDAGAMHTRPRFAADSDRGPLGGRVRCLPASHSASHFPVLLLCGLAVWLRRPHFPEASTPGTWVDSANVRCFWKMGGSSRLSF